MSQSDIADKHPEKEVEGDNLSKQLASNNNPIQADTRYDLVIPISEEKFRISKETVTEDIKIEKRWITKTKRIEVPFSNEEVYVNDRQLKYYGNLGGNILSKVKKRIKEGLDSSNDSDQTKQDYILLEEYETKRETIPVFEDANNNSRDGNEKIIPIFGEEIVISKRMVKVGELVIKKYRVTVNKKIDIDIRKEKATVEYPDGTKQVLQDNTQ